MEGRCKSEGEGCRGGSYPITFIRDDCLVRGRVATSTKALQVPPPSGPTTPRPAASPAHSAGRLARVCEFGLRCIPRDTYALASSPIRAPRHHGRVKITERITTYLESPPSNAAIAPFMKTKEVPVCPTPIPIGPPQLSTRSISELAVEAYGTIAGPSSVPTIVLNSDMGTQGSLPHHPEQSRPYQARLLGDSLTYTSHHLEEGERRRSAE